MHSRILVTWVDDQVVVGVGEGGLGKKSGFDGAESLAKVSNVAVEPVMSSATTLKAWSKKMPDTHTTAWKER